jgi:hypothetical protein
VSRLRYDGLSGTLGAAHNDSTTTLTLAAKLTYEGGDVPTIAAPNYLDLSILDGDGKCSEVVRVTAYTSAATTATVTRGVGGTTANAHDNGATFVHGPTAADFNMPHGGINTQTGNYTLTASDAGKIIVIDSEDATAVTVPPASSVNFAAGTVMDLVQLDQQVSVAGGSGVTVTAYPGSVLAGSGAAARLLRVAADSWVLSGQVKLASYAEQVLADSPLVYWRCAETSGTSATDSSGNGRTGTYAGTPTFSVASPITSDADDLAVTFDGSTEWITVADGAWMDVTDLTVEFWMRRNGAGFRFIATRYHGGQQTTSSWGSFIGGKPGDAGNASYLNMDMRTDTGTRNLATVTSVVDNAWHHVAFTWDGTWMRWYVDGVLDSSTDSFSGQTLNASARDIYFGRDTESASFAFPGSLDEFAMYDAALPAARIAAHYAAATA